MSNYLNNQLVCNINLESYNDVVEEVWKVVEHPRAVVMIGSKVSCNYSPGRHMPLRADVWGIRGMEDWVVIFQAHDVSPRYNTRQGVILPIIIKIPLVWCFGGMGRCVWVACGVIERWWNGASEASELAEEGRNEIPIEYPILDISNALGESGVRRSISRSEIPLVGNESRASGWRDMGNHVRWGENTVKFYLRDEAIRPEARSEMGSEVRRGRKKYQRIVGKNRRVQYTVRSSK